MSLPDGFEAKVALAVAHLNEAERELAVVFGLAAINELGQPVERRIRSKVGVLRHARDAIAEIPKLAEDSQRG